MTNTPKIYIHDQKKQTVQISHERNVKTQVEIIRTI